MEESNELINNGVARIKPEFLVDNHIPTLVLDYISVDDKKHLISKESVHKREQLSKKLKTSRGQIKNVLKGQNKNRGPTFKLNKENTLCPRLVDIAIDEDVPKCQSEKCSSMHDISSYLFSKPGDIAEECYVFSTYGYCPRGLTCRFGKCHTTANGRNIRKNEQMHIVPKNSNYLSKELQHSLRKRSYDFSKTENIIQKLDSTKEKLSNESNWQIADSTQVDVLSSSKLLGFSDDCDIIKTRVDEKKKIDWKNKLILSPLTTVGNLPFRRICKEFGADVTCGEMALASSLLQVAHSLKCRFVFCAGSQQEWALVRRHQSENIFGVQICGNNQYVMSKCAQLLQENSDVNFIDVNLGCPIDQIYQQGAGSGLLRRERVLKSVLESMSSVIDIPLTVKTRTGVYKNQHVVHNLVSMFVEAGVSLISIHGRTREQRYTKLADWNYIDECAQLAENVSVFGNGDILSFTDYYNRLEKYPHIGGALIARGALYKPWLFAEIKEQRHWDISSSERMDILKKYVNYGLDHWGSDDKGVENTRRFLLEWMSFLHRYIPVGLLERPPQRMNQRPPIYKGRDELETLLGSPNCQDWIRISEMLLGSVPEGFHFLPKHKANSWK